MISRILTDGRDWPPTIPTPSFAGYSIGRWLDEDGDGRFERWWSDPRAAGPRPMTAPDTFPQGQPDHRQGAHLSDPANKDTLYDEITVIDHALTRTVVDREEVRPRHPHAGLGHGSVCAEGNQHVVIEDKPYMLSSDGYLMPSKKGQRPPDLDLLQSPRNRPAKTGPHRRRPTDDARLSGRNVSASHEQKRTPREDLHDLSQDRRRCGADRGPAHDLRRRPGVRRFPNICDWNGQWRRPPGVNNQWDPSKPRSRRGAADAEYQAAYEANIKDQEEGRMGTIRPYTCIPTACRGR